MKKVSIICPFFNEDDILEETILAFMDQTYKNKEIILLDNAHPGRKCTEIAKKYAKKYKWIKYYYVKNIPGKWATHYYMEAMKHATGEVIYMADANAKIMPKYLELTVPLIKGDVAGVVGKVIIWPSGKWLAKFRDVVWSLRYNNIPRLERETKEGRILPRTFSRAAYDKVGGFNPDAGWGIDIFFNRALLKHGYKLIYEPKAEWWHQWRDEPKALIKYSYKFGKLNEEIIRSDKKQLLKIAFFLSPLVCIVLGFFNPLFFWYVLLHPILLMMRYIQLFLQAKKHKHRGYVLLGPLVSYMQNVPYAFGFIRSWFIRKKK
ncbi:glycosyltransferase [Candidatus Woesearchaeota archaeon]|nr:glycosyltransferase [Candidatus Woesearchaeota archaeon]